MLQLPEEDFNPSRKVPGLWWVIEVEDDGLREVEGGGQKKVH